MSADAIVLDVQVSVSSNATTTVLPAGGSVPFNIRSPYLGMNWLVATQEYSLLEANGMRIVFLLMAYWAILPSTSVNAKTEDWAAPLLKAIELQSKGEYVRAYELMREPANKGNGLAQFNLALHHDLGWSRKRNQANACLWYERAAKNNMPLAMQKYADCLNEGITAPSDGDVALYWYQMAFQNGIYESACSAGKLLIENSKDSRKDIEQGLDLLQNISWKGSIEAALFLGNFITATKL